MIGSGTPKTIRRIDLIADLAQSLGVVVPDIENVS
jgi:hypothetical protein